MTSAASNSGADASLESLRPHMRRVMIAWLFGAGWMALVTGVPLYRFAEEMGLRRYEFTWGLLGAVPFIGALFQWIGSYCIERFGTRKRVFFSGLTVQRTVWLAVAALPWLMPAAWVGNVAILCVFGLLMIHSISGAIAEPAWTTWMADLVPPRLRGRYFSLRSALGLMVVIPVSLAAGFLLDGRMPWLADGRFCWLPLPIDLPAARLCGLLFVAAAVLGASDILMFRRVPDVALRPYRGPTSLGDIFGPPLRDKTFVRFLAFYMLYWVGMPGVGFYIWRYAINELGVNNFQAQLMFMVAPSAGTVLFAALWGKVLDRFGRKVAWTIAALFPAMLPLGWIFVQPDFWWLGVIISFVGGLSWYGVELSNFNALLHFSSGQKGSSGYQATFAMTFALAGILSGVLFGSLAGLLEHVRLTVAGMSLSYFQLLFFASFLIRIAAYVVFLPRVHDDGHEPVHRAIRFMFIDIYNTVYNIVSLPLRVFGEDHKD